MSLRAPSRQVKESECEDNRRQHVRDTFTGVVRVPLQVVLNQRGDPQAHDEQGSQENDEHRQHREHDRVRDSLLVQVAQRQKDDH